MNANTRIAYAVSAGARRDAAVALMDLRGSFKSPALFKSFGERQQRQSEDENAHGNCGAQRPIVCRAEKALYYVGDHRSRSAANKKRSEKISQRKDERKRGAGQQSGHGERQDDAAKRFSGSCPEILRGFEQRAWNGLERGVNGEKHEGRV